MRLYVFFFNQKTAYEMRISDWSSDVCSSDLHRLEPPHAAPRPARHRANSTRAGPAAALERHAVGGPAADRRRLHAVERTVSRLHDLAAALSGGGAGPAGGERHRRLPDPGGAGRRLQPDHRLPAAARLARATPAVRRSDRAGGGLVAAAE